MFVGMNGRGVPAGYHLTELKSASFDTVDCGGQVNRWHETIVQLWVSPDPAEDRMTAAKFLKIFDKVCGMIPLKFDAEIRIEYGDENFSRRHTACVQSAGMNIRRVCCSNRQQQPAKRAIGAARLQTADSCCAM
jgi:hypothetical protein